MVAKVIIVNLSPFLDFLIFPEIDPMMIIISSLKMLIGDDNKQ